ncbi:hypothetical protein E2562_021964 [Oryza meyeriana var. granulata]|uniref:BHLH domain-containing protein n=1 Tax=Oryza meyeriana var. granulata TaxID=110450 RepID=A0A6G1DMJ4_9ORYZ|nr:hypothetical protein E2562_021964 [Oryza meyeriana var. granulata]
MALEAVLLSRGLFGRRCAMEGGAGGGGGGGWGSPFSGFEGMMDLDGGNWDAAACSSMLLHGFQELEIPAAAVAPPPGEPAAAAGCPENAGVVGGGQEDQAAAAATAVQAGRRKRRRAKAAKNKEEVESQRMTHIAVERNRRKQMNEYLAVLRSLMPPSYAQRGDQASIIGGAINYVKELEQLLQSLETRKSSRQCAAHDASAPFASFFTFPQYSMKAPVVNKVDGHDDSGAGNAEAEASGSKPSTVADVEVTMVESHANLRVLSRRRPRQLLRLVVALQGHRLNVLHLNMTSAGHMVLYSFSLKVEDDCQLTSVDEIATAAHQIIENIHEEQGCSLD